MQFFGVVFILLQGFDIKQLSQLFVDFTDIAHSSIKVSGTSRVIENL
jgi:hypothetical protein